MLRKSSKKVISFVLCVCLVIGIFPFTMFFNAQEPELPNHLIINQAAGVGNNADGALSHSFVEIYNPTDALVDLSGYSLQYAENGNVWKVLNLTGSVPAKHSYLVRANGSVTSENARYTIYYADQNWGIVISNDSFKIALVGHQENLTVNNPGKSDGVIDLIGAYNSPASVDYGEGLNPIGGASKQRSVRRINFQDTDDNAADFESLHYGNISLEKIAEVRPCSLRDGEWDAEIRPEMPVPPVSGTISFSEPAGIYKNEFYLTLETALQEAVIRYTLDGEDPTAESSEYSAQLRIYDRTSEDEVMVQRTGTTGPLAFNGSYVRPPLGTVYKGTVVKAQLFTEDGEAVSPVYVNSYFVNPDMAAKYGGIPIISISVPSDYFFDTNFGIYQRGPFDSYGDYIYPDYRKDRSLISYGDPIVYNFDQRGFEWERPAYVEMFDPASGSDWEQNSVISQGIGVRINGGNSRHSAQKALRFYTRTGDIVSNDGRSLPVHNGKSFLDYDFFQGTAKDDAGNPITGGFKRLLLRASGNDINNAFMRHSLVNVISAGLAADTQAYRPVVVFLNGEFWGFYEMIERFDDEYLVQHYGGSNNNYDILENPSALHIGPEQATPDSIAYFNSVVNKIEQAVDTYGISSPEVYAEVLKYVDEASLIDINILETFFGNADWVNKINEGKGRYGNNQQIWRYTGTPTNKPGQDGKYRWMLVDMDHSFDLSYGG
ncbi:MAG: CotH kinase family protein, partial [Oscillospiraceae bacterium]|nr:CotH kinase family protein [Oscillospiraceae bacterium]